MVEKKKNGIGSYYGLIRGAQELVDTAVRELHEDEGISLLLLRINIRRKFGLGPKKVNEIVHDVVELDKRLYVNEDVIYRKKKEVV